MRKTGEGERLAIVRWAVSLGLFAAMCLTPRLWIGERSFPVVPFIDGLTSLPWWATLPLMITALACPRKWLGFAFAALTILVVFDINRLQPWLFAYGLLMLALCIRKPGQAWAVGACIVSATYFWSGMQKMNLSFASEIFPWLVQPVRPPAELGFAAALTEALIGVCLFVPRTRTIALVALTLMHMGLLAALGPLGHNFNSAVWPWNVCMPIIAFALFFRNPATILSDAWNPIIGKVVVPLVAVMPVFNFFDLWDDNLSASLYSGRTRDAWVRLAADDPKLPREAVRHEGKDVILDLITWALTDLNVPPYPEPRVYRSVAKHLPAGSKLFIRERKPWLGATRTFKPE